MLTNFGLKNFQYSGRQNILITPDQNISKGAKCFSTPRPKYVPRRGGENVSIAPYCILLAQHLF